MIFDIILGCDVAPLVGSVLERACDEREDLGFGIEFFFGAVALSYFALADVVVYLAKFFVEVMCFAVRGEIGLFLLFFPVVVVDPAVEGLWVNFDRFADLFLGVGCGEVEVLSVLLLSGFVDRHFA